MSARRFVVVDYVPLNGTLRRLYPLDFLAAQGVKVEYWDLSRLFGHERYGAGLEHPAVRRFASWEDVDRALVAPEMSGALILVGFPYEPKTFSAFRRLSRARARLGRIVIGVLPEPRGAGGGLGGKLKFLLDPAKIAHFALKRAQLVYRKIGGVRDFDVAFVAGAAAAEEGGARRLVPINHYDYDDWLETRAGDGRPISGRYAVFLDQQLAGHPDFALTGVRRLIDAERFYRGLNSLLARLEKEHGLEVVIAAHPKADYSDNPFDGRKTIKNATRALVRFCDFALTTYSTAMSFAVLDRKPLVFLSSDDIDDCYRGLMFPRFAAQVLGRGCADLDRPCEDDVRIPPADDARYDEYKDRYLVLREREGRLSRELYLEYLLES